MHTWHVIHHDSKANQYHFKKAGVKLFPLFYCGQCIEATFPLSIDLWKNGEGLEILRTALQQSKGNFSFITFIVVSP